MNSFDNNNSIFICGQFQCCGTKSRQMGIYVAGMLFALGWWMFIDGLSFSSTLPDRKAYAGFEDWAPGIITTFGMIIVCLIDKEALRGSTFDDGIPWRARFFLFVGFALMAGGFAGSVSVLVVKYVMHDLELIDSYIGIGTVVQCGLIMLSTAVLWIAQDANMDNELRIS
ncbi:hypothetical protein BDB00DRAFT_824104 [Zychaea mexicana]|uniref:uncharacterized protein n=1 Tax=Zychaea mexicana TaxID=64656 RepID=UPI0022FF0EF1|nr:uncharacterized protein BDB00DRAFT_824104 [Zychaea mexicana]KAI9493246.1 hypothetical protein BDB00DRAFT_824104 [Zychaea mexicana]